MERNTNNGRYRNGRTAEDIIDCMSRNANHTTTQLADATGIPRRTTLKYLNELAEDGKIEKQKPNVNTAIWILRE